MRPLSLIEIWQHFSNVVWRKRADDTREPIMNTNDPDLAMCELQHRVDQLLDENDKLMMKLQNAHQAIIALSAMLTDKAKEELK